MHSMYVDPTKAYADFIVDGSKESLDPVLAAIDRAMELRWRALRYL